jgi:hypothetical protein
LTSADTPPIDRDVDDFRSRATEESGLIGTYQTGACRLLRGDSNCALVALVVERR